MRESFRLGELLARIRRPIAVEPGHEYFEIGIRSFGKGIFHKTPVLGRSLGNKRIFQVEPEDLIFNIVFAWEGAVAVAGPREGGRCGSHRFPTYRARPALCDVHYLNLFFQSSEGRRILGLASPGGAGRNKTLNQEMLLGFSVELPIISEQRRIVHLLQSVDDVIVRANDASKGAAAAYGALAESEIMETTAKREPVGSVASVNPKVLPLPSDAPFYPMDSVQVWSREPAYSEPRGERSGARAQAGDVLFARITPCLENGKTAMVPKGVEVCGGSTELSVLRAKEGVDPRYLYCWATVPSIRAMATALMTGTTGRQRLAPRDLASLPFPMRDLDEQEAVVNLLFAAQDVVTRSSQVEEMATRARGAWLADLMSGRHEIGPSFDDMTRLR
jgi:type I restriction enzyme, S subunit